jgi:hypothetical protein
VEQELLSRPETLNLPRILVGFVLLLDHCFLCVVFCKSLFVLFLLAIMMSVLRLTASDYSVGIVNPFLHQYQQNEYTSHLKSLNINKNYDLCLWKKYMRVDQDCVLFL